MTCTDNRFARDPVATISALLLSFLLIGLISLELFLRTFSGLGNPVLYELSPLYGYRPKPDQVIEPKGKLCFPLDFTYCGCPLCGCPLLTTDPN